MGRPSIGKTNPSLAEGYSRTSRLIEAVNIGLFFLLEGILFVTVWPFMRDHLFLTGVLLVIGYIAADFVSGLVHWIGDTWGSVTTPIFGKYFIRPFREHHVDQMAITRHDFVETNGANCLATNSVLLPTLLIFSTSSSAWSHAILLFAFALTLGIFGTNQFHKWSHLPKTLRPRIIHWLQSARIILEPVHHSIHHVFPYDKYYCITTGWLNPLLTKVRFFRGVEYYITKFTRAIPRKDDLVLTRARTRK